MLLGVKTAEGACTTLLTFLLSGCCIPLVASMMIMFSMAIGTEGEGRMLGSDANWQVSLPCLLGWSSKRQVSV